MKTFITILDIIQSLAFSFFFVVLSLPREEIHKYHWVGLFIIIAILLFKAKDNYNRIVELEMEINKLKESNEEED